MKLPRRSFLASAGAYAVMRGWNAHALSAHHTLTIEPCTLDIGRGVHVKTVAYNGRVPGPELRLREGVPVTIDVINKSSIEDLVHWHGLTIDARNDGAMEEGSPMIAPGGRLRYSFTPRPAGTRWYHTHNKAGADLSRSTYTGQFGFLLIEGKEPEPAHDREVLLAIHHWEPSFVPMAETMRRQSANKPATSGSDVGYKYATINQHMLGAGEPVRVRRGERILFRLLNASATENVVLALPGHRFTVVAMDGNPVPRPQKVEALSLAVAERIDAIVEMDHPGKWILGSTLKASRSMGLGIVIEYAGSRGDPVWRDPDSTAWDYSVFADPGTPLLPDATVSLLFMDIGPQNGSKFDTWTVNGRSWPDGPRLLVEEGKRYRLIFRNASADQHPMHLHRHSFEVTKIGSTSMRGLIKDTVNVMPLDTVAVDFVADNPGDALLHCHMQLHMDFGFMQMVRYKL